MPRPDGLMLLFTQVPDSLVLWLSYQDAQRIIHAGQPIHFHNRYQLRTVCGQTFRLEYPAYVNATPYMREAEAPVSCLRCLAQES